MDNNTNSEDFNSPKYIPNRPSHIIEKQSTDGMPFDFDEIDRFIWVGSDIKRFENKVNAFDAGAYILNKMGEMTTMKLHKLLYYCQAWSLVWDEHQLFEEEIEAWANGPVIRPLFSYHRGYYTISKIDVGNADVLSSTQKETIDSVLNYYGGKTSQWLIELTHLEDPWKNARKGLEPLERGDKIISKASMAEYYSSL